MGMAGILDFDLYSERCESMVTFEPFDCRIRCDDQTMVNVDLIRIEFQ